MCSFLYEILLGQKNGPRLGTFVLLLSIKETIKLIEDNCPEKFYDEKVIFIVIDCLRLDQWKEIAKYCKTT